MFREVQAQGLHMVKGNVTRGRTGTSRLTSNQDQSRAVPAWGIHAQEGTSVEYTVNKGEHPLYGEKGEGSYAGGHPKSGRPTLTKVSRSEVFWLRDPTIRGIHAHVENAKDVCKRGIPQKAGFSVQ